MRWEAKFFGSREDAKNAKDVALIECTVTRFSFGQPVLSVTLAEMKVETGELIE